jgi:hypothetical protein
LSKSAYRSNEKPELIPDPIVLGLITLTLFETLLDLGSEVVSCGILTTITQVRLRLVICHAKPEAMTTSVAQLLVEK